MLCYSAAFSQKSQADSLARQQSYLSAKQTYEKTISGNAKVFNGVEYVNPLAKKRVNGHPNFANDDWQEGVLSYDGQLYENVALQYNLLLNKVLVENVQSHATIELNNVMIDYFQLDNHTFVRLPGGIEGEPNEMLFDQLYNGSVKVYVKRYKTIKETPDQKVMVTEFLDKRKIYLFKDGQYFSISNKKSALNAFEAQKTEMKKLLSQQHINFRTTPELAMVVMGQYYDQQLK
jgi:hypothetical protein